VGVVVVCALLMAVGAVAAARWGHLAVVAPWTAAPEPAPPDAKASAQRFLWHLDLVVISGLASGLVAAGAGGRLVMRLLAVTAGDQAQGRITEAEEVVGRITVGGTIGFIIFVGLFGGLVVGAVYMLLRRWLPPARLGAVAFGAFLLLVFATRIEPLRADNPDFGLVGPGWLALAAFSALALFHALVLAAIAGRLSRSLPVVSGQWRTVAAYLPLLLLLLTGPFLLVVLAGAAVVTMALRLPAIGARWQSATVVPAGRVVLAGVTLVALPGFVGAVRDIFG
jgi:hypothetical protein